MLASLRAGSGDRVRQSFVLIQQLRQMEAAGESANEEILKIQKGLFFVSLYASLEFTLTNAVSEFLSALQTSAVEPRQYRVGLLPTLLNREFNAVTGSSKKTNWDHKRSLIERVFSQNACTIDNDIFPAESTNISADHFQTIWNQLEIPGDPLPPGVNPWTVNEIKEHRNAIAHGREKAATIGSRFTLTALEDRHRTVESICAYTVMSFEEHLSQRTFLAVP